MGGTVLIRCRLTDSLDPTEMMIPWAQQGGHCGSRGSEARGGCGQGPDCICYGQSFRSCDRSNLST